MALSGTRNTLGVLTSFSHAVVNPCFRLVPIPLFQLQYQFLLENYLLSHCFAIGRCVSHAWPNAALPGPSHKRGPAPDPSQADRIHDLQWHQNIFPPPKGLVGKHHGKNDSSTSLCCMEESQVKNRHLYGMPFIGLKTHEQNTTNSVIRGI